jgi:hypothetical protein
MNYTDPASFEPIPKIERISPDNQHPTFPPPPAEERFQYGVDIPADHVGKGKDREH